MKGAPWVVCAGLALVACKSQDTYQGVFVEVRNPANVAGIVSLRVLASNAMTGEQHMFPAGAPAGVLEFPASFSFTIPASRTGEVDVAIDALDASNAVVANGAGFAVLAAGSYPTIVVELQAGASLCGNGWVDATETCDDGNRYAGDGCSHVCQAELWLDGGVGSGGTLGGSGGGGATGGGGQLGTGGLPSTGGREVDAGPGGVGGGGVVGTGGGSAGRGATGGLVGAGGQGGGGTTGTGGRPSMGGTLGTGGAGMGGIRGTGGAVPGTGGTLGPGTGGIRGTGGVVPGTGGGTGSSTVDCSAAMPSGGTSHCGQNAQGAAGGLYWSTWSNIPSSSACITTFPTPAFSASWSSNGDYLARVGLEFGTAGKPYDQYGTMTAQFTFTKTGSGGGFSYIGLYGWTTNPCVEWYIVEDSFGAMPFTPYNASQVGNVSIDGEVYKLFHNNTNGTGGSRCSGVTQWNQYWSVRQKARQCGTVTLTEHFNAWETAGLSMGNLLEARIFVEVGGGTGSVAFPIANVTTTR